MPSHNIIIPSYERGPGVILHCSVISAEALQPKAQYLEITPVSSLNMEINFELARVSAQRPIFETRFVILYFLLPSKNHLNAHCILSPGAISFILNV